MSQKRWMICSGCLKYFSQEKVANKAIKKGFCSGSCFKEYNSCYTCGKYFEKDKGFQENYCSQICLDKYQVIKEGRLIKFTMTDED